MQQFNVTLAMRSYIADPYWPEQERVISIRKQSGVDRARSEEKREATLTNFLKKIGVTQEQYRDLEKRSKEPWYRVIRGDEASPIIIPAKQLAGMLVHAAEMSPAGTRVKTDNLRSLIHVGDFKTNRVKSDGTFSRYILPKDGKGNPLSNQRRYSEDEYIKDFSAQGIVEFADAMKPANVKELFAFAIESVGVGACRKMDYGRGELVEFKA